LLSMSMRPKPSSNTNSTPSSAIEFKDEFVNSTASLAASHDETVSHILSRLDQLQTKIAGQPESTTTPQQQTVRSVVTASRSKDDLHARLTTLESIHEDSLKRLSSKLDGLEKQLSVNKEAEVLMGRIASKFNTIESQLAANKEAESLMSQIATKFSQVETRLKSAVDLHDRVAEIESRTRSHSRLHDRVSTLESKLTPDPEQERIIERINSKLDILEQRKKPDAETKQSLGANAESREERIQFLQSRIEKLKELRSRYEPSEDM